MPRPPSPVTDAGHRACAIAETLAARWSPGATERDRAARFDPGLVSDTQRSGLAGACVPEELGGLGVDRLQDLMAIVHRLAEADGSAALIVHMHLSGTWGLARQLAAQPGGDQGRRALLRDVAAGNAWVCAAVTEAGTNFFHPTTTLAALGEGWVLDGTKVFATGSPAATHFSVNARIEGGRHHGHLAQAIVPAATPGVRILDNWDGLGMRASGSGAVHFDNVALAADAIVSPAGPYGTFTVGALCGRAFGNVGNVTAMAGLAAAANRLARDRARGGRRIDDLPLGERATFRQALGALEADAFALLAVVESLGRRADEMADALRNPGRGVHDADARDFMADFQSAKLQVNRLATAVVDQAMSLAGGAGYTAADPIGRLVRDVRAGQFMQPFSPHEALGFIGAVAAGTEPDVRA